MSSVNLRLPEHRRPFFEDFYRFHIEYDLHPGMVYRFLPAIAQERSMSDEEKAWLVWLNGNTQNPATTLLLLDAAPNKESWRNAVDFWNRNYHSLEWDTDRRYHKARFGEATEKWVDGFPMPSDEWRAAGASGWESLWKYSSSQPYMGRLSAWSMAEYAYILNLHQTEPKTLLLDQDGSTSHRNGLALLAGGEIKDTPYRKDASNAHEVATLEHLGHDVRSMVPRATFWTLESALCTYKSFHKPNRRYPGVYADMAYYRLLRAESRFGHRFNVLWDALGTLPDYLQLARMPKDPGLAPVKQNFYLATGSTVTMGRWKPIYRSEFDDNVDAGKYGTRST